ncbi:MAG: phosphoribosylglycinamide formyltransferase [Methylococcaceae bacterium]|nr:phosphoribosylglycinamide formyltransferase [Methylococcaceae bacterium]
MTRIRLGFLVSHRGSNMQAVIDACNSGRLAAIPAVLISNNASSQALQRAEKQSIPYYIANSETCADSRDSPDQFILRILLEHRVDLVILAGYMKKVGAPVLSRFAGRIINIHPSLLPKYGGQGMYGLRVHQEVLDARERETGATVHLVEEDYDQGPILAQEKVPIKHDDTAKTLAARVLETEHKLLVETLSKVIRGEIATQLTRR